jgi:hypothetical protein
LSIKELMSIFNSSLYERKLKTMGQILKNGANGSLKNGKVLLRTKPQGYLIIWATIPPQKKSLSQTIENPSTTHAPRSPVSTGLVFAREMGSGNCNKGLTGYPGYATESPWLEDQEFIFPVPSTM